MASLPSRNSARTLVRTSLELGRVLADRNGVTFRARGTCMYPTVRAGDTLRIQSRALADISVGDIAVCQRWGALFAHRVIGKGEEDGRACIVTRPDRSKVGSDGPTFDEGLLGTVVAIERKGKSVPLHPSAYPWLMRGILSLRLMLMEALSSARPWWDRTLSRIQRTAAYRFLASSRLAMARPQMSYRVRVPMPLMGDAVYRELSPEAFDLQKDWRGRPVERWTLAVHLNGKRQADAWVTFARDPTTGWQPADSFESVGYRGTGLREMLLRRAGEILDREE